MQPLSDDIFNTSVNADNLLNAKIAAFSYQDISIHYASVLSFCKAYLKDEGDAQEACQEVMLNAFTHIDSFEHRSSVKTWLLKIAFNLCTNVYRKQQNTNAKLSSYYDEVLSCHEAVVIMDALSGDELIELDGIEDIRAKLGQKLASSSVKLSQLQQDILAYRFIENLSFGEIANTQGLKESKVKMSYYRAIAKLNAVYLH